MTYPKITRITCEEYQERIVELSKSYNIPLSNRLSVYQCGLAEEAGEVAGLLKRFYRGDTDHSTFAPRLTKEIGDMFAYAVLLARVFNIDFEDILLENLEKIEKRLEEGKQLGEGSDR